MPGTHTKTVLAIAIGAATLGAQPAAAQVADDIVLNIMRQCAKIDDPTARLACYDNNIRAAGGNPAPVTPGAMAVPQGGGGALVGSTGNAAASGFGAEDVRTPVSQQPRSTAASGIVARVTAVEMIRPNQYRFALEDGAVWEFSESVASSYSPPRQGSEVEIDRASLGSFLMRYDNQNSVRVRRVR